MEAGRWLISARQKEYQESVRANSKNKTKGTQIRKEIVYSRALTWLLEIGWARRLD